MRSPCVQLVLASVLEVTWQCCLVHTVLLKDFVFVLSLTVLCVHD